MKFEFKKKIDGDEKLNLLILAIITFISKSQIFLTRIFMRADFKNTHFIKRRFGYFPLMISRIMLHNKAQRPLLFLIIFNEFSVSPTDNIGVFGSISASFFSCYKPAENVRFKTRRRAFPYEISLFAFARAVKIKNKLVRNGLVTVAERHDVRRIFIIQSNTAHSAFIKNLQNPVKILSLSFLSVHKSLQKMCNNSVFNCCKNITPSIQSQAEKAIIRDSCFF